MKENKITTYLLYAVGEIILVVVGILIAVRIDDWNKSQEIQKQQLKHYQDILSDLRKDAIHFQTVLKNLTLHQQTFYAIYDEIQNGFNDENPPFYDHILYNVQFTPTLVKNQQQIIDQLTNSSIRQLLNDYSEAQYSFQIAIDEYNMTVVDLIRPYTLEKKSGTRKGFSIRIYTIFSPRNRSSMLKSSEVS